MGIMFFISINSGKRTVEKLKNVRKTQRTLGSQKYVNSYVKYLVYCLFYIEALE